MKKIKINWKICALGGLIIGIIISIFILKDELFINIKNINMWWNLLLSIGETTLAGALIPLIYNGLMRLKINKIILWVIYLIVVGIIVWFTIMWFIALVWGKGIVGL